MPKINIFEIQDILGNEYGVNNMIEYRTQRADDADELLLDTIYKYRCNYSDTCESLIHDEHKAYEFVMEIVEILRLYGVEFGDAFYSSSLDAQAVMVAEATNLAAKSFNYDFYEVKDLAVYAAYGLGSKIWWQFDEYDNTVAYLYSRDCGVASFHQVYRPAATLSIKEVEDIERYKRFQWSGQSRQWDAFEILTDTSLRDWYALATRPRSLTYRVPLPAYPGRNEDSRAA